MHRRQFIFSAAALTAAPRLVAGQTPGASPTSGVPIPDIEGNPVALSPDGARIASLSGDGVRLAITDIASGTTVRTDELDLAISPLSVTWAPDSSAVALSLEAALYFRDSDIYIVDAASGTLTDLTDDDPGNDGADEISISATPVAGDVPLDLYPAWSPDSQHLAFARTMWSEEGFGGTTLMTMSRDGGEPEQRAQLQPTFPISVYTPMWWLENDAILLSQWMSDPDDPENGIWRVEPDGTTTRIVTGDIDTGIPGAVIADVTADGARASVYSQLLQNQFGSNASTAIWFDVDLTTGAIEPWEPALGLPVEPTKAMAADGKGQLVAPPVFGPADRSVAFMTRAADETISVSVMDAEGSPRVIGTFEPAPPKAVGRAIAYRLDWADSGDLLVITPAGVAGILRP